MKYPYLLICLLTVVLCEDFYDLLGVSKNADDREIRKAFKKLALTLHPDKNKDDKEAHSKFIRVNRAYEVLKDEDLRKKYDLHGEEGLDENRGQNYRSWSFYKNEFGIYDDDPEIITLGKTDFEQSVLNSDTLWFINFYSPMCSHCHHLAPEWRKVARELEGVVRIGAVNCEDAWVLCRSQSVRSYPTLRFYSGDQRYESYEGQRSADALVEYVMSKLEDDIAQVTSANMNHLLNNHPFFQNRPWVLIFCGEDEDMCPDRNTKLKLAAILEESVAVGQVNCVTERKLCKNLGFYENVVYFPIQKVTKEDGIKLKGQEAKEMAEEIIGQLPPPEEIDAERMQDIIWRLEADKDRPWVIHFGKEDGEMNHLELYKMPALLPHMKVGQVSCDTHPDVCHRFQIDKYPTFLVFKVGGVFEVHLGRITAHDVANFAKDSSTATNIRSLTTSNFPKVQNSNETWFVDFFAPWCPPCMRLLPEFRKASRNAPEGVKFGTVDCTVQRSLCNSHNIRSYPTTLLYNRSVPHKYHGGHSAEEIVDFIEEILRPKVVILTGSSWEQHLGEKPKDEMWVVDFFAPWCGHCQQLEPHWRKLAKLVSDVPKLYVAQIDCTQNNYLCKKSKIRAFPTIRLYMLGSYGDTAYSEYNGYSGYDEWSLRSWIFQYLPSSVVTLNSHNFVPQVLESDLPWLVDFHAPWCGHCKVYAPEFQTIAKALEGRVKCGKLNCQSYQSLCQKAGVRSYPTVKLYTHDAVHISDGFEVPRDKDELLDFLEGELDMYEDETPGHDEL